VFSSKEIPQADSLLVVEKAVAALASGAKDDAEIAQYLGYSARQGHYYRKAAELCGFAIHFDGKSQPTKLGRRLVNAKTEKERVTVLQEGVMNVPLIAALVGEFSKTPLNLNDRQKIIIWLNENSDLSESTAIRRSSTILNYLRNAKIITTS
jgi:hypothetical protein